MTRHALALGTAICLAAPGRAVAHDGPPYPIVSDQRTGPYVISVWTDPDTTDDGSAGGQFWVTFEPDGSDAPVSNAHVTITATPLRGGTGVSVDATESSSGSRFGALVLDHEGRFRIDVHARGPRGEGDVSAEVDATYDLRPTPFVVGLYALPFVLAGALWIRVLVRRRAERLHR